MQTASSLILGVNWETHVDNQQMGNFAKKIMTRILKEKFATSIIIQIPQLREIVRKKERDSFEFLFQFISYKFIYLYK